jgi:hypothetical protein
VPQTRLSLGAWLPTIVVIIEMRGDEPRQQSPKTGCQKKISILVLLQHTILKVHR